LTDSVLSGITSTLQNIQDLTINAGSGTANDADRKTMAIEISSNLDQLLSLANSTDAEGNSMFSGYKTNAPAFTKTSTGASYNGDQGQALIQVDTAIQIPLSNSGDKIFQIGGQDTFKILTDLVNLLNTPVATPANQSALVAGLKSANTGLSNGLDSVSLSRTTIGSYLNRIDALDISGSAKDLSYAKSISDLQDVDYNSAVSQLTSQKTMLEAAQASFVKISSLTLFNYIT
jgi:flagellar hook-associated protein 3 FlgL